MIQRLLFMIQWLNKKKIDPKCILLVHKYGLNPNGVTPRIPNNVNHTCKSEYYNVYEMLHFVKYLNNRVKFSINKVNIN